jgi:hypothetical protein
VQGVSCPEKQVHVKESFVVSDDLELAPSTHFTLKARAIHTYRRDLIEFFSCQVRVMLDRATCNKDVRKFVTHNWSGNHIGGDGLSSYLVLQHTTTSVGVCVAAHCGVHEDTERNNDDDKENRQSKDHPSPEKLIQHVFIHSGSRRQLIQANLSITLLERTRSAKS